MKITDVTVTLFAWGGIPATRYGRHTGQFGGQSQLGLVRVRTDDGLEGHAFLGSAMRPAHLDAQSLIHYLKPIVLGQDPLERERLWQAMWQRNRATEIHHGGNSLNNVANLHVSLAVANCEFFEVLLPAPAQKYGLVEDIEVDRHGLVHGPTDPGLGARIDFDLIEREKLALLR